MKKFIVRTLAGALFAAVLIGAILYGWRSFTMLFLPMAVLSVEELGCLLKKHRNMLQVRLELSSTKAI